MEASANDRMQQLMKKLRIFANERDWEQFHSPKNLAMALSVEVSEILEHFQWLTQAQSQNLGKRKLKKLEEEIGDVQIYLARLADVLGLDPMEAAFSKLKMNEEKYPAGKVRGKALKYTEYES